MLLPIEGAMDLARVHNDFIIHALRAKDLALSGCSYQATVKTGEVSSDAASRRLLLNILALDLRDCADKPAVRRYVTQLARVDYEVAGISSYEAPTTCYYFVHDGKLVLVGHYGFPLSSAGTPADPGSWIAQLKRQWLK